jgi:hypothetical protein
MKKTYKLKFGIGYVTIFLYEDGEQILTMNFPNAGRLTEFLQCAVSMMGATEIK